MNVLVLDGNENQAVSCVRSLAKQGHRVYVGATNAWSKAGLSRYTAGSFRYADPAQDSTAFVETIITALRRHTGALVLPMTERTTLPLSAQRDALHAAGGSIVAPAHVDLLRAFNKHETTKIAESLGVRVPRTIVIDIAAAIDAIADDFPYPAVLKPASSQEYGNGKQLVATGRPEYAKDPAQFRQAATALFAKSTSILAQEFVNGAGMGYYALVNQGTTVLEFAHRRLRDVHPTGSGSSLRTSATMTPQLRDAGRAILKQLNWHGVAMVEFRVLEDGTPVFIEVNGRFWNSLELAVRSGADFPAWLARLATGESLDGAPEYRPGVRCRWLLGDVRHLIAVWRGAPAGFPLPFPSRWKTTLDFLIPQPGTYHDNFRWNDPLPELGDWLDFFFHKVLGALTRERRKGKPV
jgi:predicted ATP-grasp superfamily ATP-dependent carboligase